MPSPPELFGKGLEFTGVHEEINAGERDEISTCFDGEAADTNRSVVLQFGRLRAECRISGLS
jgi:hypothetical protein